MAKLVSDHYPVVFRFCARRIGLELAKDAAQETFITAQRRLNKFENRSSMSTWLLGIAQNHCRNLARKKKVEFRFSECWQTTTSSSESGLIDLAALRTALLQLSVEHREAVVMHEIEGLTYEEIAEILNVPSGTVKSRLHHAFENLRKALSPRTEVLA
jgi:RNA polymerase sigma-70 factor (ECF subfamily)